MIMVQDGEVQVKVITIAIHLLSQSFQHRLLKRHYQEILIL